MAYTRNYPQNITPKGTNVYQGFTNDDNEIKRILGLLSNTGSISLAGTKRQCVLYGATDSSGNPSFLTASALTVSIDGSATPVLFSFANGFSAASGTIDSFDAVTSLVSGAWTIPANGTYYLYVDKDISTGLLSFGLTANQDTYTKVAPTSPVLDQCYFNTNEMKMYRWNGSSWEPKLRVFVASVVSTASVVTIVPYSMESKAFVRDTITANVINAVAATVSTINGKAVDSLSPHILQRNTEYAVGAVAYASNLPSWAHLECTTAGKTAATESSLSNATINSSITDGSAVWIVRTANIFDSDSSLILKSLLTNAGGIVSQNLAANGYVAFSNGLLLQWGFVSADSQPNSTPLYTATFPLAFSTACYNIQTTNIGRSGYGAQWSVNPVTLGTSNFTYTVSDMDQGTSKSNWQGFRYVAIGT
jgi:hypothetical protein